MYHQAQEVGRLQALARFGEDIGRSLGLPAGALGFDDWEVALRTALRLPAGGGGAAQVNGGARLLVLDEFTYLLLHSPELPSVLQALYDESQQSVDYPSAAVVMCGSALSVMSELLSGAKPLRGRAQLDISILPFDYREAATFWGVSDPQIAFQLNAVFGGTPGYRSLVQAAAPSSLGELPEFLARSVLNPSHALFAETDYLLREDPRVRAKEAYQSILAAVAGGQSSPVGIGGVVGRDHNSLRHPLGVLVTAGFLTKRTDVLNPHRPLYYLADPIVRFEALITTPCRALLEERDVATAWKQSAATFSSGVLGPHFEDMCRVWTRRYAQPQLGVQVGEVGSAVLNDSEARSQHELDVVGLARGRRGANPKVVVIGEAKSSSRPRTASDLTRLEKIRELLVKREQGKPDAILVIFGMEGFDHTLTEACQSRGDVHLVSLEDLYA